MKERYERYFLDELKAIRPATRLDDGLPDEAEAAEDEEEGGEEEKEEEE